ncbi:hypothetical protein BJ875DRAFT_438513 [Amylocarpus encephaloides]|uniref:Uncharacterized protein n=1 Tax=Amylocarpus encephaloides TaxID=45428 RepID=A0A9P7YPI6_9HELO|nr:hypothetical protein BJ875DRAFT_438513 [Amylocarpus encephaloides]
MERSFKRARPQLAAVDPRRARTTHVTQHRSRREPTRTGANRREPARTESVVPALEYLVSTLLGPLCSSALGYSAPLLLCSLLPALCSLLSALCSPAPLLLPLNGQSSARPC